MDLLSAEPELSVEEIASQLHINNKTAAAHVQRLAIAGLVMKRNEGASVRHKLTHRSKLILKFLRTLA